MDLILYTDLSNRYRSLEFEKAHQARKTSFLYSEQENFYDNFSYQFTKGKASVLCQRELRSV